MVVLCEYSKFWIESNSYFSIRFEMSTKFSNSYRHQFLRFNRMTPIFHLSNHAWQQTKSTNMESCALLVSSKDSKRSLIWSHFMQIVSDDTNMCLRCHKNSWIYLTSTYYWWLLRPMITVWFDSKFQIIAQLFA